MNFGKPNERSLGEGCLLERSAWVWKHIKGKSLWIIWMNFRRPKEKILKKLNVKS